VEDRGVKSAPFVVLIASEMPGILAEVSCVSHAEEARLLRDGAFRETIAEALARGVRAYADARNQAGAGRSGNG
jgi:N-acetylmuramoyl-L-alanine amidase